MPGGNEDREGTQWYSNKDLFERIEALGKGMGDLQTSMQLTQHDLQATRDDMRRYNDLRGQLTDCQRAILTLQQQGQGRAAVGRGVREWGLAAVALGSLAIAIISLSRR